MQPGAPETAPGPDPQPAAKRKLRDRLKAVPPAWLAAVLLVLGLGVIALSINGARLNGDLNRAERNLDDAKTERERTKGSLAEAERDIASLEAQVHEAGAIPVTRTTTTTVAARATSPTTVPPRSQPQPTVTPPEPRRDPTTTTTSPPPTTTTTQPCRTPVVLLDRCPIR